MTAWLSAHVMRAAGAKTQPAECNPYAKRRGRETVIKAPVRALRSIFCRG